MRKVRLLAIMVLVIGVLATMSGCSVEKKELQEIESATIGTMAGSVNEELASNKYPKAEVKSYANYKESSAAVLEGDIDYAIMDYATAMNFARHNDELTVLSDALTDEVTAMALNPKFPERNKKIQKIITGYLKDGTIDEIISHWMKEDGSDYEILPSVAPTKGEKLRIAVTTETEPRCFLVEGKPAGMVIELMDRICADLGMVPEYQDMPFGQMMDNLKAGKCDVIPAMYNTAEREEIAEFTDGYFPNPQVLLVRSSRVVG